MGGLKVPLVEYQGNQALPDIMRLGLGKHVRNIVSCGDTANAADAPPNGALQSAVGGMTHQWE